MSKLNKVRVQLLDEETGSVLEEVDVMTSADAVSFADGQTFQQKLDAGLLKGQKGDTGAIGPKGATGDVGPKGEKGDTGEGFSIFKTYASVAAMVSRHSSSPTRISQAGVSTKYPSGPQAQIRSWKFVTISAPFSAQAPAILSVTSKSSILIRGFLYSFFKAIPPF